MLRIGRIDYLNVWPLYQGLEDLARSEISLELTTGHPSRLNAMLAAGKLDMAPSSSFEYLLHADNYLLLPDLSISSDGPVQSVILACPFDLEEMPRRIARGLQVGLSRASASSLILLKILWNFAWQWPEPRWMDIEPGEGPGLGIPFLEIGDTALRLTCETPPGWRLMDLGGAWKAFTGLPFIFGVWMVRHELAPDAQQNLKKVVESLTDARQAFAQDPLASVRKYQRPGWLSLEALADYWRCIRYDFGPAGQAGLVLFGEYARCLGLLAAVPGLRWMTLSREGTRNEAAERTRASA